MARFELFPQLTRIENLLKDLVAAQRVEERLDAIEAALSELKVAKDNEAELAELTKRLNAQSDELKTATETPA